MRHGSPTLPSPFHVELMQSELDSLADQMALTILKTAYSLAVKGAMDFSTALFDARGNMLAQGLCLPLHMGAFPDAMAVVLERFHDDIDPGDIMILNDPFAGGMHLPDIFLFEPVFAEGELLAWSVSVVHHQDVGGKVPGSSAVDAAEMYQEGLCIPPMKLIQEGQFNRTLLSLIERNVRLPDKLMGDLQAQLAACRTGAEGIAQMVERWGSPHRVKALWDAYLDYGERLARQAISQLPDGTYRFEDQIDDDGAALEPGQSERPPIRLAVEVRVDGDGIAFDFAGTSPQVASALNSTFSCTKSGVYLGLKSILGKDIPNSSGFYRAVAVSAPKGSVLHPVPPAATAARGLTVFRLVDTVMGALAQAAPERVFAASEGGNSVMRIGGRDESGRPYVFADIVVGSWGGRFDKDGIEGVANIATNLSNAPVEAVETEFPVRVEAYGFVADTGGAGRRRGGLAIERHLRFLGDKASFQIRSDRRHSKPYGLFGGREGTPSSTWLLRDGQSTRLPAKVVIPLRRDDLIVHHTAGAGGYGPPHERDPALVERDVWNEKLTPAYAAEVYGYRASTAEASGSEGSEGAPAATASTAFAAPPLAWQLAAAVQTFGRPGSSARPWTKELDRASRRALLDWMACAAAGWQSGEVQPVLALAVGSADPDTLLRRGPGVQPEKAALLWGTLAHAWDLDDTHLDGMVHAGAPVVAAALAAAMADEPFRTGDRPRDDHRPREDGPRSDGHPQNEGRPGSSDFLAAIAVGYEVTIGLARALNRPPLMPLHKAGFHPTAVLGVFGAAAAAARLWRLPVDETAHALALATSFAGGLLEFVSAGGMIKRLHPGKAAHDGVLAARLAARGFTGAPTAFEGRDGFLRAFQFSGDAFQASGSDEDNGLPLPFPGDAVITTSQKLYPCCHHSHAALHALSSIQRRKGFAPDDIHHIDVFLPAMAAYQVGEPHDGKVTPQTLLEGQMSLPYCAAVMLREGRLSIAHFSPQWLGNPHVQRLARRIVVHRDASLEAPFARGEMPARVEVRLRSGATWSEAVSTAPGMPARPLSDEELTEKLVACAVDGKDHVVRSMAESILSGHETIDAQGVVHRLLELRGGVVRALTDRFLMDLARPKHRWNDVDA